MTWILIVITSVTVIVSPHPSLEACRSDFKDSVSYRGPGTLYPGEIEHAFCIAASGKDIEWRKADPEYPF